jgi:hypothetical protein
LFKLGSTHDNELEIDIYEKEDEIGGQSSSKIEFNGNSYDLKTYLIDFTQNYMRKFAQLAG